MMCDYLCQHLSRECIRHIAHATHAPLYSITINKRHNTHIKLSDGVKKTEYGLHNAGKADFVNATRIRSRLWSAFFQFSSIGAAAKPAQIVPMSCESGVSRGSSRSSTDR